MNTTNPRVDFFFVKPGKWHEEVTALRTIVLSFKLTETLKWGVPCYTSDGANVVLIHTFKDYCALLFFKGAILKDPKGILIQQTKNVQAARQIRFTSVRDIRRTAAAVKSCIRKAIAAEKAGIKVPLKKTKQFAMPAEFKKALEAHAALRKAFNALTPGRQRGYLLYFGAGKQPATRMARIEKYSSAILSGKGLGD